MHKAMKKIWFQAIGIDFGSENLRVWWNDASDPVSIPGYIALDVRGSVLAVGENARVLSERNTAGVRVVQPIERGVIRDEKAALLLLRAVLGNKRRLSWLISPVMMMSVPAVATRVQRQRAENLLVSLGARETYVIPQSLAAAIGGGVPAQDAAGSVVVQLGAGVIEAAAISLGGIVASASSEFGGKSLLEQLRRLARERYAIDVSYETVRKLLPHIHLGLSQPETVPVVGKDIRSGEPTSVYLESKYYEPALIEQLEQLVVTIKKLLSQIPPAITSDVVERGLLLSGGLAQLHGLPLFLTQRLEVPCAMMERPEMTVIHGITYSLLHLTEYTSVYDQATF